MRWVLWIFLCIPCLLHAEGEGPPRVAILPFGWAEDAGRDVYGVNRPGSPHSAEQSAAADAVLWQHLPSVISADWVERGLIQQMLDEQEIQIFSSGNALKAGRWLKADVALVGIIKESKRKKSPYIEYSDVDLSVVDLNNGESLAASTWEPELVHRRHVAWPAESLESLKLLCADLLKEGLENRAARKPLPKIVPLFFRNTSDVERLNFWEDRLLAVLADQLPARVPVRVLRFPGMRSTRQEQQLSLLGLTDADPDAWKRVGDFFIWGEYAEKNPEKPTGFQDTEVTFTWNFWDGGAVLVSRTESFRVSEAPSKVAAWLEEVATLVKARRTAEGSTQSLDRVHSLLMDRALEILGAKSRERIQIAQYEDWRWSGRRVEGEQLTYALQLLDLAAFFKPGDPACQMLRLAVGSSSNQERYGFLDRFSGKLSGEDLVFPAQVLRALGREQSRWRDILNRTDSDGAYNFKKNYDKEQREAANRHLSRWKTEAINWVGVMQEERDAGRPIPDPLAKFNFDLCSLMAEHSPREALQLLELTWVNLTLPKRLRAMGALNDFVSVFLANEETEDQLLRVLLTQPPEEQPVPAPVPSKQNPPIRPRYSPRMEQKVVSMGEWRVLPLQMEFVNIPEGDSFLAQSQVAHIRTTGRRMSQSSHAPPQDESVGLVGLPAGLVVESHLVQDSVGMARLLPFRGIDYAQSGGILYIARRNEEPAWVNMETGETGVFALEEGLPTRSFTRCEVLDENHILWSGRMVDPATSKPTPRRAIWQVSAKKWIRLKNEGDLSMSSKTPTRSLVTQGGGFWLHKPVPWRGLLVHSLANFAISPLSGEKIDLGWILEKIPSPSPPDPGSAGIGPAREQPPDRKTFCRTRAGWLGVRGNVVGLVSDNQTLLWRVELPGTPGRAWVGDRWAWFEFTNGRDRRMGGFRPPYAPSRSLQQPGAPAPDNDVLLAAVSLTDGAMTGPLSLRGEAYIGSAAVTPEGLWIDYRSMERWPGAIPPPQPEKERIILIPNPRKLDLKGIAALAGALLKQAATFQDNPPRRDWPSQTRHPWWEPAPPLVLLAGQGSPAQVRQALKDGAPVSEATATGWTPLMTAVQRGNPEIVGELLARGADPAQPSMNGWTPVAEALRWQHYDIAAMLLKEGAPFSHIHINSFGPSEARAQAVYFVAPLEILQWGDEDVFLAIMDKLENPIGWLDEALSESCGRVVAKFVESYGDKLTESQLASVALRAWQMETKSLALAAIRRLPDPNLDLAKGDSYDPEAYKPILALALQHGDLESLKHLVGRGGRLAPRLITAKDQVFTMAVSTKDPRAVRLAAAAGAQADLPCGLGTDGGQALFQAVVSNQSWPMVEALLEAGIAPLSKNREGQAPSEWPGFNRSTSSTDLHQRLLAVGKVEIQATETVKNLDFIWQDDEQAARAWLANKPSLEYGYPFRDKKGCFPLSAAVMEGSEKYLRLFLEAGANPNGVPPQGDDNPIGRSHLMLAAMTGRLDLVQCLVESGAATRLRDRLMATARHLAANEECARYLREQEIGERKGEELQRILERAKYNNKTYQRDYDEQAIIELLSASPQLLLAPTKSTRGSDCHYWQRLFAASGKPEVSIRWIRSAGVDLNVIQSRTGELCLVQAVIEGSERNAKILMLCGALPEAKGRNGRNALMALDVVKDETVRLRLHDVLTGQAAEPQVPAP